LSARFRTGRLAGEFSLAVWLMSIHGRCLDPCPVITVALATGEVKSDGAEDLKRRGKRRARWGLLDRRGTREPQATGTNESVLWVAAQRRIEINSAKMLQSPATGDSPAYPISKENVVDLIVAIERMPTRELEKNIELSPAVEVARPASSIALRRRPMTDAPHICGNCRCLLGTELRSPHGGHRAAILLGLRHTVGNRFQDSRKTAVAPQPLAARQAWA
jgi:hypothetical protein